MPLPDNDTDCERRLRQACRELDDGLRQGKPVRAEQFLANCAELAADPEAAVELIYTEFVARQALGETAPLEEWYQRFPQWQPRLERQFKVHLLMDECAANDTQTLEAARFGHYDNLEEIGQGSMGVVYRARDTILGRTVALKMISAGADAATLIRFRREAEAISLLQHPHIVQVYEVNQWQGQPYLALEYVEGVTLAEYLHQRQAGSGTLRGLNRRAAAALVATLARAMHHVHERGIVHRDLKPGNVLLCRSGQTRASISTEVALDQPKITDFGLSVRQDTEVSSGGSAAFVGTPGYMAPEQIWGDPRLIGPPADTYALGAILSELLTASPSAGVEKASKHLVDVGVPRDLAAICSKCLARQPSDRYASAAELADDLDAYLDGRPVKARTTSRLEQTWKWMRRSPAAAALLAVALLLPVTLLIGSLWYNMQLQEQQKFSRRSLYNLQLANVGATWQRDPVQGLELLTDPDRCPEDLRDFTWRFLHHACNRERQSFHGHARGVYALAFSADGGLLASASSDRNSVEEPQPSELRLWEAATGRLRATLPGTQSRITDLAFTADGQRLITSGRYREGTKVRGEVTTWNLTTGKADPSLVQNRLPVRCVELSPDGSLLAAGANHKVLLWDLAEQRVRRTLTCPVTVEDVVFSPSSEQVAVVTRSEIMLWSVGEGELIRSTEASSSYLWGVAYSPDNRTLATYGIDRDILLWDTASLTLKATLRGHTNSVRSVAFCHEGLTLVSGGDDFAIRIWDVPSASERTAYRGHKREVNAIAVAPDGLTFASAGMDGHVKTWDLSQPPARLDGHAGRVLCAAFTPDGRYFTTGGLDKTLRLWDSAARKVVAQSECHDKPVRAVVVAPDGRWLASAGEDRRIVISDLPSMALRREIFGHQHFVTALALSADGKQLASASIDRSLKIWDPSSGRLLRELIGDQGQVKALAFTVGGRELISSGSDGTVRMWDLSTGQQTAFMRGGESPIRALAISPDGTCLAAGSDDQSVQLWDLAKRSLRRTLKGHSHWVGAVVFSPDGKTLVSATGDRTPNVPGEVKFWDPETGQVRATFSGHAAPLAFSPEGQVLLVGANDRRVSLWEGETRDQTGQNPR